MLICAELLQLQLLLLQLQLEGGLTSSLPTKIPTTPPPSLLPAPALGWGYCHRSSHCR